jgi:hypothetical protein
LEVDVSFSHQVERALSVMKIMLHDALIVGRNASAYARTLGSAGSADGASPWLELWAARMYRPREGIEAADGAGTRGANDVTIASDPTRSFETAEPKRPDLSDLIRNIEGRLDDLAQLRPIRAG